MYAFEYINSEKLSEIATGFDYSNAKSMHDRFIGLERY